MPVDHVPPAPFTGTRKYATNARSTARVLPMCRETCSAGPPVITAVKEMPGASRMPLIVISFAPVCEAMPSSGVPDRVAPSIGSGTSAPVTSDTKKPPGPSSGSAAPPAVTSWRTP